MAFIAPLRCSAHPRAAVNLCHRIQNMSLRSISSTSCIASSSSTTNVNNNAASESPSSSSSSSPLPPQYTATSSTSKTTDTVAEATTTTAAAAAATETTASGLSAEEEYANAATPPPTKKSTPSEFALRFGAPPTKGPAPDDELLGYVTNLLMRNGDKRTARLHVGIMLQTIRRLTNNEPLPIFRKAVELAAPHARLLSHKKSAKVFQIPVALFERQRVRVGLRWIEEASHKRRDSMVFGVRLGKEVGDILNGTSSVLTKKAQIHKQIALQRANIKLASPMVR